MSKWRTMNASEYLRYPVLSHAYFIVTGKTPESTKAVVPMRFAKAEAEAICAAHNEEE